MTPAVLDQTMSDLKAMGQSSGMSTAATDRLWDDSDAVVADLKVLPAYQRSMDPFYYFENHFSGFAQKNGRLRQALPLPAGRIVPGPGAQLWLAILDSH